METVIISIEGDYGKLSGITAEEAFDELKNFAAVQINDKVFLGLDFLTEIRDSKILFKRVKKERKKFLLS